MISLRISNLTVYYDLNPILIDIYLEFESGKIYGIVGPNGAGKSTLLKSILELVNYEEGDIVFFENKRFREIKEKVAYIPQKEIIDWDYPITVFELVLLGRYVHTGILGRISKFDREIAINALKKMNIYELKEKQISELSGGQQQRALIARAICQDAQLYLLDEPFVGVDIITERKLFEIFQELKKENKTLIIVDHDLARVQKYDELVFLNRKVIAKGKPKDVLSSENILDLYSEKLII
ncbi:MAG: metal ABC transporter ATP-binding protein [candidate division WOR-3 bacterium]